jgi:predicted hotdog family 3-hydroxylacyl-ACP dehydratase
MRRWCLGESEVGMPDIRTLVPHSGPMVLLDRVVTADEDSLCAEVTIRADSLFCEADGIGAWVGIEYMAQTIGAYVGYIATLRNEPVRIGFLLGIRRYECSRPLFPLGSLLRVHAKRLWQSGNGLGSFECLICDDTERQLASATVTVFQPDGADDLPQDVRDE